MLHRAATVALCDNMNYIIASGADCVKALSSLYNDARSLIYFDNDELHVYPISYDNRSTISFIIDTVSITLI